MTSRQLVYTVTYPGCVVYIIYGTTLSQLRMERRPNQYNAAIESKKRIISPLVASVDGYVEQEWIEKIAEAILY